MGEIVNLKSRRKARERAEQTAQAAANRVRFGRTLAEKRLEKTILSKQRRDLEGRRIESGEES